MKIYWHKCGTELAQNWHCIHFQDFSNLLIVNAISDDMKKERYNSTGY
jgi:hypothetical protein